MSASPAHAGKDCAVFTATLVSGDEVLQTFTTPTRTTIRAAQIPTGSVLQLRGTFVEFDVDLDSFTVTDYTLKGLPRPTRSPAYRRGFSTARFRRRPWPATSRWS